MVRTIFGVKNFVYSDPDAAAGAAAAASAAANVAATVKTVAAAEVSSSSSSSSSICLNLYFHVRSEFSFVISSFYSRLAIFEFDGTIVMIAPGISRAPNVKMSENV